MANAQSMPRDLKPMMIGIPEKTNKKKMNKLLNGSTTKNIGNSIVIIGVDKKTSEASIVKTVETQLDLNRQFLDRTKSSLKLPTGLRKQCDTISDLFPLSF